MINIKNKIAIEKMANAGKLLANVFAGIPSQLKVGMSTLQLDQWIEQQLVSNDLVSQCKGYGGYKHVSCISVNDVVVHGVPQDDVKVCDGDLVKVDVCASYQGYCADMARCFFIGKQSTEVQKLVDVAQLALNAGIEHAVPGNRLGDISAAIQRCVEQFGYGIVRDFAGHGIGKRMHEDPEIPNYGKAGQGALLQPGMTFAIEPMITIGSHKVFIENDGWTVKTEDKSLAAHVEDTILITSNGPRILTRLNMGVGSL